MDLPEAIFSNLGLIFLAHTHVPTIWNEQNQILQNIRKNTQLTLEILGELEP